ncbi:hypothetical protein DFQ30_008259, partial [Apophysomyces sp. BC1015]
MVHQQATVVVCRTFGHPDGPTAAAEAMARHLETVYDGHLLSTRLQHDNTSTTISYMPSDFPITEAAVTSDLERLPPKKAPGIDHVRSEMLKP